MAGQPSFLDAFDEGAAIMAARALREKYGAPGFSLGLQPLNLGSAVRAPSGGGGDGGGLAPVAQIPDASKAGVSGIAAVRPGLGDIVLNQAVSGAPGQAFGEFFRQNITAPIDRFASDLLPSVFNSGSGATAGMDPARVAFLNDKFGGIVGQDTSGINLLNGQPLQFTDLISGAGLGFTGNKLASSIFGGGTGTDVGSGIGGAAGFAIGGPIGAGIGSFFGGALGSLFGGPPTVGPNAAANLQLLNGRFALNGFSADNKGNPEDARKLGEAASGALNKILDASGATIATKNGQGNIGEGGVIGNFPKFGGVFSNPFGGGNDSSKGVKFFGSDVNAALNDVVLRTLRERVDISGNSPGTIALRNSKATNADALLADVNFAAALDKLANSEIPPELARQLQSAGGLDQVQSMAGRLGLPADLVGRVAAKLSIPAPAPAAVPLLDNNFRIPALPGEVPASIGTAAQLFGGQ